MKITFKSSNEQKVTDENGKEILSFKKSKALPTREQYSIINPHNEKIGYIEKIRSNFGLFDLPQIVISINNDEVVVKKDIQQFNNVYEISSNDLSIIGNLDSPQFSICKNEKILASIAVEKEEVGRSYLIDIADKSSEEKLISILFGLNWIIK